MSLLGRQVFANPTTPIWGQGGGGGGSNFQFLNITEGGSLTIASSVNVETQLVFNKDVSGTTYTSMTMTEYPDSSGPVTLALTTQAGAADTLLLGDLVAGGAGTNVPIVSNSVLVLGKSGTNALGLYQQSSATGSNEAAYLSVTPNTTELNLSNVKTINGAPYAGTFTSFDFSNQAGAPVAEAPASTILNTYSFTAPANGKLYMESLGNFVSTALGGGGNMGFSVNGTILSNALNQFNAYNSNVNLFGMSMYQIAVTGGVTYDISSIAQCSALPPAGSDLLVQTSRLFTLFTPN